MVQHYQEVRRIAFPLLYLSDIATDDVTLLHSSGHYWGLSGLLLAVPLYAPSNGAKALYDTIQDKDAWLFGWSALWAVRLDSTSPLFLDESSLLSPLRYYLPRPPALSISFVVSN